MMRVTWLAAGSGLVFAAACGSAEMASVGSAPSMDDDLGMYEMEEESIGVEPAPAAPRMEKAAVASAEGGRGRGPAASVDEAPADDGDSDGVADGSAATRSWFPEAFLWRPLVATNAAGVAEVDVRVPDQLTTWRVLALAHDRSGGQAGAVSTFDSRMELYLDPLMPGWLMSGDRVELPVRAVNTTANPFQGALDVRGDGPLRGGGGGPISVAAGGTASRVVALDAVGAGEGVVRASLGSADAVERRIRVSPAGRPVVSTRGGTLSSTRSFGLDGAQGADPATDRLDVLVFPGALAVVQQEVERLSAAGGEGAYGFALATHARDLAAASGAEVDADAIRRLQIVAWQGVARASLAPRPAIATDLLVALGGVSDHELAEALIPRLTRVVADDQRGDGTWSRADRAPLQQIIVQTAYAVRALPEDATGPRLRACGALERFSREIRDPLTAAAAIASGVLDPSVEAELLSLVRETLYEGPTGATTVANSSGKGVWGAATRAEFLAWLVLALPEGDPARGDLVAELMAGYRAGSGFGGGLADVLALDAVSRALPPIAGEVSVVLSVGGVERDRARLDASQPRVPAALGAALDGTLAAVELSVDPPVAGLAFVATRSSWVPWTGEERLAGVDVEVEVGPLAVARDGVLTLRLAAPSGEALSVEQGLPAGVSLDEVALRATPGVVRATVLGDRVAFTTKAFEPGEVIEVELRVVPAFAGSFSTAPLVVRAGRGADREAELPPVRWKVRGG